MSGENSEIILPLIAFVIAALLRLSPLRRLLLPLSLFAVMIHELGHGLMAMFTGGKFLNFKMNPRGGVAYTQGGISFLVVSAGYVGTAIFGAVLVYLTNTLAHPGHLAIALGVGFAVLTLLFAGMSLKKLSLPELLVMIVVVGAGGYLFFISEAGTLRSVAMVIGALGVLLFVYFISDDYFLTVVIGVAASLFLIGAGIYGEEQNLEVTRFILNFLAFMVGLNAIYDSWYLFHLIKDPDSQEVVNDATRMAEFTPLPSWFWALAWSANAAVMLGVSLLLVLN